MCYAIDYDKNNVIELKKVEDAFTSAANYIKKLDGIKMIFVSRGSFIKQNTKKYLNTSTRK